MYCKAVIMYDARNRSKYMLRHISKDFAIVFNKHGLKLEPLQTLRFKWGSRVGKKQITSKGTHPETRTSETWIPICKICFTWEPATAC